MLNAIRPASQEVSPVTDLGTIQDFDLVRNALGRAIEAAQGQQVLRQHVEQPSESGFVNHVRVLPVESPDQARSA